MTETHPKLPRRRVMLVSYWFPPAIGAAAERVGSFARYLPEHQWQTHVLTAERSGKAFESSDVTLNSVVDKYATSGPVFADYDPRQQPQRVKSFLRRFIFPDRFVKWQQAAYKSAMEILRKHPCDIILGSFPPASSAQLALRLSRDARVALVLDFRDLWFGPGGYRPETEKAEKAHRDLQRETVAHAAALIAVSEPMADQLAIEHGFAREKIFVIPNGYEPLAQVDKPTTPPTEESDSPPPQAGAAAPLTIAHVGTVIARNRPDLFFQTLTDLKQEPAVEGVAFEFVGNLSRDYLRDSGLADRVSTTGLVPRDRAQREMMSADALLLLTGSYVGRWGYNAKLFEYIQTGRPILCLEEEPGSNDRKLLERFVPDRAFFAPLGDADALAEQIGRVKTYVADHPEPAIELDSAFRDYSRVHLAARLAECLDGLVK